MALPTFVIIGAMKCGTSALHALLGAHPDVAVSTPKELNFFYGPGPDGGWSAGNWHRGLDWYASCFVDAAARGEASPGYTSPRHASAVAERMARLLPDLRLLYCVRDPLERAVSQYRHHLAEGDERRPLAEALLDPASQYVARSRYHERLAPYRDRFPRAQIEVVVAERLDARPREVLARCFSALGVDPSLAPVLADHRVHTARVPRPHVDERLSAAFTDAVADDVASLRDFLGDPLEEWSVAAAGRR